MKSGVLKVDVHQFLLKICMDFVMYKDVMYKDVNQ